MAPQRSADLSYPDAVKFLEALFEGVPDNQHLEIRTLKPGGGGKKNFYTMARLRRKGFAVALPGAVHELRITVQ